MCDSAHGCGCVIVCGVVMMFGASKAQCCAFGVVTVADDCAVCGCDVCHLQEASNLIHLVPLLPSTFLGGHLAPEEQMCL